MEHALEVLQMGSRTLGSAVWSEEIDGGRRLRSAPAALLSSIDPEASCLRPPASGIEHRHRRVVGEQMIRGEHILAQAFVQRLEPPASAADPSGERRPREIDAVAGEDLRLPIERGVIAVLADQHLGKQCRRCQAAGDHPLRSRSLHHCLAGPAGIFGASGADHAQLRRNPVQHLAHALSDHMQRTTTAGAGHLINIEPHVLTWQMIGQRLAMGRPFSLLFLDPRTVLLFPGEIAVEILKPERQLIGIEALGTAAELRALQLLDDGFETLDLTVAMFDSADNIANQAMQKCCICREIVEIELHIRFYSNMLIRRSNFTLIAAGFCVSTGEKRSPESLRRAPVDAFERSEER